MTTRMNPSRFKVTADGCEKPSRSPQMDCLPGYSCNHCHRREIHAARAGAEPEPPRRFCGLRRRRRRRRVQVCTLMRPRAGLPLRTRCRLAGAGRQLAGAGGGGRPRATPRPPPAGVGSGGGGLRSLGPTRMPKQQLPPPARSRAGALHPAAGRFTPWGGGWPARALYRLYLLTLMGLLDRLRSGRGRRGASAGPARAVAPPPEALLRAGDAPVLRVKWKRVRHILLCQWFFGAGTSAAGRGTCAAERGRALVRYGPGGTRLPRTCRVWIAMRRRSCVCVCARASLRAAMPSADFNNAPCNRCVDKCAN